MNGLIRFACTAFALVLATAAFTAGMSGCETTGGSSATEGAPEFSIRASNHEVLTGEIVTLTTRSANLAGRQTHIDWKTDGGDLRTEENGRIARVQFDRPGTYTVSARLMIDDGLLESDSVSIQVRPVTTR
jgi:hypothetical protein